MTTEQTLSIIKPDAVKKHLIGVILARFEAAGLSIREMKMLRLTREQAEQFYAEHKGKPFFEPLVNFMTSGPVVVQVLAGEDAIALNRRLMGDTDPRKAQPGTIRRDFADSIDANIVHGSDAPASAAREIGFFFPDAN